MPEMMPFASITRTIAAILMTAFSTIFGIFPIVFGIGLGLRPEILWQLQLLANFSSLLLTLIVVPVVYTLLDDLVLKFTRKAG